MAELTVDKTYAKGLFLAAAEVSKTDEIMEEAKELSELLKNEDEFFKLISSPTVSGNEKKELVRKIFEGKISTEMLNFIQVLIDKGRARHFHAIVRQYEKLLLESRGFSRGIIYSAVALSSDKVKAFEEKAGKLVGKKVSLDNRVDSSLIGGVRIFVEGRLIDASVKKRLSDLKGSLKVDITDIN